MAPVEFHCYIHGRGDTIIYKFDPEVARSPDPKWPNDTPVTVYQHYVITKRNGIENHHSDLLPLELAIARVRTDKPASQPLFSQPGMAGLSFMPTSADMSHIMDRVYEGPKDLLSLLPPAYTFVATAGTGIYVCEPLTKQLVAVKICYEPDSIETLQTELEALQAINAYKETEEGEACDEMLALFGLGQCLKGRSPYTVTCTFPIVCTLQSLKPHFLTIPEVFIWLIYTKLANALHWPKDECEPGIAHGDLHSGNVLIGYPTLSFPTHAALPKAKIIDFGRAVLHPP
ncbi:hypothetical protein E8E11_008735 [Didymella keratinophila]|nr:hypothetical protein E8E11_008735 [Didymella keratinophila]